MTSAPRALITGGTGLLGSAIAKELGRTGFEVHLNHLHDAERAAGVVKSLEAEGIAASAVRADVLDETAVSGLFDGLLAKGPIDVLVNAVGTFHFKEFLETTASEWDAVLASNLRATFLCCRAVLPHMRSRGSGSIVNIASMNAHVLRSRPKTLPYAIAKVGVVVLTKTLAATEGRFGIRVNAISPGFVSGSKHPASDPARTIPLGREATASEVARTAGFLVSEDGSYITGAVLDVHGGAFL
jgi:NAD(P)-dependent dehydrogenase (short-subunit alcohol dehydrogenase family)